MLRQDSDTEPGLDSEPDEAVWVLACGDARYRLRLMGDKPAKIERLQ